MKNFSFINFLPPWVETNIQPAFYDKESGSVLQQTARMYAKVNQLVRHFNCLSKETKETVDEYIAKFVELKDFVDTYFENLDVQEEINNKLDEMVEDGTMSQLLEPYLQGYQSFRKPQKLYLAAFFDADSTPNSYLYTSVDGEKFNRISETPWTTARDADIIFYDNKFYAIVTNLQDDLSIGELFVSEDLQNWKHKPLYIDFEQPNTYRNYPCEWFVDDNGDVYLSGAYQVGTMVDTDNGRTYKDYRLYTVKVLDMDYDNFTLDTPNILSAFNYNLIDPNIIKKDNIYYMFAKKEANDGTYIAGTIQTFISSDLVTWSLASSSINSLSGYLYEAPCAVKNGDTYYLYVDNYGGDNGGYMQFVTSSDLLNWSSVAPLQSGGFPTRHGSIREIKEIGQKIVNSLKEANANDTTKRKSNILPRLMASTNNKYIELARFKFQGNYTAFTIKFNLFDIENNLYDSDYTLNIYRGNNVDTIFFREEYKGYYKNNKVLLVEGANEYILYYSTLDTVNAIPAFTVNEVIATRVDIKINDKLSILESKEDGNITYPNSTPKYVSTAEGFRIQNINLDVGETSITASFGRTNNYPSFSCILYGRFNAILFQGQINSNTGNITQHRAFDLTAQGNTYTLTVDDDNHTLTVGGLDERTEYTLLINDITYGDITFSK